MYSIEYGGLTIKTNTIMTELEKYVNDIWANYYDTHPKERKYLGNKIPKVAFLSFFHNNSYGNVDADKRYVVRTLELVGISKEIASEYYDKILYKQYAQTV